MQMMRLPLGSVGPMTRQPKPGAPAAGFFGGGDDVPPRAPWGVSELACPVGEAAACVRCSSGIEGGRSLPEYGNAFRPSAPATLGAFAFRDTPSQAFSSVLWLQYENGWELGPVAAIAAPPIPHYKLDTRGFVVGGCEVFTRDECERFKAALLGLPQPPPSKIVRLVRAGDFAAELSMHRRTLLRYRARADALRAEASASPLAAEVAPSPAKRQRTLENA